jgi:peptidoglycan/LPS O-acetylase OafA/YrhL
LARPSALVLLALATLAALAAFLGSPLSPWLAAFGGATFPVALIGLGAAGRGRRGLGVPLVLLWLLLAGGLAAILILPAGGPDVAGLPLGTALMIFVLVPVPLLGLGLFYAFSFGRLGIREEDLERMRRLRRSGEACQGDQ